MKRTTLALATALLLPATATATTVITETFTSTTSAPIPDDDLSGLLQSITPATTIGTLDKITVTLTTTGGWNGDLYAYLWHDGILSVLVNRIGRTALDDAGSPGSGLNLTLDDDATADLHLASATFGNPISGYFEPDGRDIHPTLAFDTSPRTDTLADFFAHAAGGEYRLFIADVSDGEVATLTHWSISLTGEVSVVPEPTLAGGGVFLLVTLLLNRRRSCPV